MPRRWELMTSPELGRLAAEGLDLALLPVGATEQHGPHLATGCDTISPEEIAWRVSEATGVVVLPAIPYGISLGHTARWPGTVSLHPQTLLQLVLEVGRWVVGSGFGRLIMLNGNGPNAPALECARMQLRYEFPRCRFRVLSLFDCSARVQQHYFSDAADIHANRGETSLLMHMRPAAVRPEQRVDEEDVTVGRVFSYDMPATTASGVVGRPSLASAADGAALARMLVEDLSAIVRAALAEEWPRPPEPQ
ncbi:MAG TPA: creatininase family protein [Xanthobacteraceae bacterium]|jgi:creatinine amidohydrolase